VMSLSDFGLVLERRRSPTLRLMNGRAGRTWAGFSLSAESMTESLPESMSSNVERIMLSRTEAGRPFAVGTALALSDAGRYTPRIVVANHHHYVGHKNHRKGNAPAPDCAGRVPVLQRANATEPRRTPRYPIWRSRSALR